MFDLKAANRRQDQEDSAINWARERANRTGTAVSYTTPSGGGGVAVPDSFKRGGSGAGSGSGNGSGSGSSTGSGSSSGDFWSNLGGIEGVNNLADTALTRAKDWANFGVGVQDKQMANANRYRMIEQESAQGATQRLEDTRQTGETTRLGMSDSGQTNRLGMSLAGEQRLEDTRQTGQTQRQSMAEEFQKGQQLREQDFSNRQIANARAAAIAGFKGAFNTGGW